jgi:glycerophosphoryl diester phosphodiesterase
MRRAWLIVLISVLSLPMLNPGAEAATLPTLVGHRGLAGSSQARVLLPENSVAAWTWANAHGANVLDLDISITEDGKFVAMHDADLRRTTNCSGRVIERYLSTIQKCWLEIPVDRDGNKNDDNTPYHPPSLEQALNYLVTTDRWLEIEMKGPGWTSARVRRYAQLLLTYGVHSRTITHSFNNTVLGYFKAAAPTYPRGSMVNAVPRPSVSTVVSRGSYAFLKLSVATKDYVTQLQAAGVKVLIYTLNNESDYEAALVLGAYGWVCNGVDEAGIWLIEHGA